MIRMLGALVALFVCLSFANGRDDGQWEETDAVTKQWYRDLTMPDRPNISCCGEADAYWADSFEVSQAGEYIAIITDTRDVPNRPHIAPGTKIVIPNHKLKYSDGNPTGHGVVFVSQILDVYCYVMPGGV